MVVCWNREYGKRQIVKAAASKQANSQSTISCHIVINECRMKLSRKTEGVTCSSSRSSHTHKIYLMYAAAAASLTHSLCENAI